MQQQPLTPEQIQALQRLREMGVQQPNPNVQRLPNYLGEQGQVSDMVNYIPNEAMNNPALAAQYNRERMNLLAQPVSGAEQALIQNLQRQEMMSAGVPTGFAASQQPLYNLTPEQQAWANTLMRRNPNFKDPNVNNMPTFWQTVGGVATGQVPITQAGDILRNSKAADIRMEQLKGQQ